MILSGGTRLGPYEILAPLGAGGMGEVYRARDARLGRDVAVKVLPAAFAAHPDRLARFEQEARASGALNHPNILATYDLGSHEGMPYLVSELLEGETLRERLSSGPLPARKAADYAAQIARGLAAAHERGIVHRDLKPENLFLTRDGRVKILDFGLAKLLKPEAAPGEVSSLPTTPAATEAGIVMGTVGYMAPEQVRGRAADVRSDLFALGAILYEMLAGRRAFLGESAVETMNAILKEEPPDLGTVIPAIPPGLDRITRHCLEKNPEERFQSARDVAFYLEAAPGAATPSGGTPALALRAATGRRRLLIFGASLLGLVAAGAAGIAIERSRAVRPAASPPIFQRLTFRHGFIYSARFTRDAQSVVYGATWDGNPPDIYLTHPGAPESRSLGLEGYLLLAASSSDDLAISRIPKSAWTNLYSNSGTLGRMPLTGGSPRDLVEDVTYADWAPDGTTLAVVRSLGDRHRLEYPIGNSLIETPHALSNPRISPDGQKVSLWETFSGHSSVIVVDRSGKLRNVSSGWADWWYLSWSPDGREIWFGAAESGYSAAVYAVDLEGRRRLLFSGPGVYDVQDVSRDGRALLGAVKLRQLTSGVLAGWPEERDLSWFDGTQVCDIEDEGKALLLAETSEAGGPLSSTFLQRSDGSPPVRLGEGQPLALSPDGRQALASLRGHDLVLLPVGAGEPRRFSLENLEEIQYARWLPQGGQVVLAANEPGGFARLHLLDLQTLASRPIAEVGLEDRSRFAVSPDGRRIAAVAANGDVILVSTSGGTSEPAPGLTRGDQPIEWTADGRSLYVVRREGLPVKVLKVELGTGRREIWKELTVSDAAGIGNLRYLVMTPDGRAYSYTFVRGLTDLFLVEGLK